MAERSFADFLTALEHQSVEAEKDEEEFMKVPQPEAVASTSSVDSIPPVPTETSRPRPRFCRECGTTLKPDARFCGHCGSPIP